MKTHLYDPNRCQTDDCLTKRELNTRYCRKCLHKLGKLQKAKKMYELGIWNNDKRRFDAGTTDVKDELAISRLMTEKVLRGSATETDLLVNADKIERLNTATVKIAAIQHKLNVLNGQLLDKSTVLQFADNIITLVDELFGDNQEKVKLFGEKVLELCENLSPHTDKDNDIA